MRSYGIATAVSDRNKHMMSTVKHTALVLTSHSLVSDHVVDAWLGAGHGIAEIWTQDSRLRRTPTKGLLSAYAAGIRPIGSHIRRHRIPVRTIDRLKDIPDLLSRVADTGADTLITSFTGLIVPEEVLLWFSCRAINVHPTLLPHYKGPVARSAMLLDGMADKYGGLTIHALSKGIDEGPIIAQKRLPRSQSRNYADWDYAAARAAAAMITSEVQSYLAGELVAEPQDPSAGNYRRFVSDEFCVTSDKPLAAIKEMFSRTAGLAVPFRPCSPGLREVYFATAFGSVLGRPTGMPPRIGWTSIEADILDARVRLVRKSAYDGTLKHPALRILASRLLNSGSKSAGL